MSGKKKYSFFAVISNSRLKALLVKPWLVIGTETPHPALYPFSPLQDPASHTTSSWAPPDRSRLQLASAAVLSPSGPQL